jgi:hypothetical protein
MAMKARAVISGHPGVGHVASACHICTGGFVLAGGHGWMV